MGIKIQPEDLEIPTENPFANDLLSRETATKVLTQVLRSVDGPCVLSIDGPYGSGKTTFLRLWTQYLHNQEFQVVSLNAWETDFSGDPFLALSEGILSRFEESNNEIIQKHLKKFGLIAREVAILSVSEIVRLATMGALNINPIIAGVTGTAVEQITKEGIDKFTAQRKSVRSFKEKLEKLAKEIADTGNNRPLVIMIDELDRCRPSYAIEMLEVAKHLFSVDNIVFALGINRSQLAHSVKCLYGQDFDADAYLKRFFDVDFNLPEPEKVSFIKDLTKRTGIESYFVFEKFLCTLLGRSPLSLREISHAIHHLGLVFASLGAEQNAFAPISAMAVILKFTIPESYHQLRYGNISDCDVVDNLFTTLGIPDLGNRVQDERSKTFAEAEAIIAACYVESSHNVLWKNGRSIATRMNGYWTSSLISKYMDDHSEEKSHYYSAYKNHFNRVICEFSGRSNRETPPLVGFIEVAERLELLTPSLQMD